MSVTELDRSLKTLIHLDTVEARATCDTMKEITKIMQALLVNPVSEADIVATFLPCKPISMTAMAIGKGKAAKYALGVYIKNQFQPVNPLVTLDTSTDKDGKVINRLIAQADGSTNTLGFYTDLNPGVAVRKIASAILLNEITEGMFVPPPFTALPAGTYEVLSVVLGEKTDLLTVKTDDGDVRVRTQKSEAKIGSVLTSVDDMLYMDNGTVGIGFAADEIVDFFYTEGESYSFSKFAKISSYTICSVKSPDGKEVTTWCPRAFPVNDVPRGYILTRVAGKVTAGVNKAGKPNQKIDWVKP
jgi:hypothetical protein